MWNAYDVVMALASVVVALLLLSDVRDELLRACKPFLLRALENAGVLTREDYVRRANMGRTMAEASVAAYQDNMKGASAAGAFARGVVAEQSQQVQAQAQTHSKSHAHPSAGGAWGDRAAPSLSIVAPAPQVNASVSPPTGSSYGTPAPMPSPSPSSATGPVPSSAPAAVTPTASSAASAEAAGAVANTTGSGATTTATSSGSSSSSGSMLTPPTATEAAAERRRRSSAKAATALVSGTASAPAAQSHSSSSAAPASADRDETEARSRGQTEVSRSPSRSRSRKVQAQPQAQSSTPASQPAPMSATDTWPPPPPPVQPTTASAVAAVPSSAAAASPSPAPAEPQTQRANAISVVVPVTPLPAIVAATLAAQTPLPSVASAVVPASSAPCVVPGAGAGVVAPDATPVLDISLSAQHDGRGREVSESRRGENAYVAWLAAQHGAHAATAPATVSPQQPVPLIAGHPLTSLTVLRSVDCGVPVEEYFSASGEKVAWRRGNIWDSDFIYTLTQGLELMKYGSWGRPHIRKIRFVLSAEGAAAVAEPGPASVVSRVRSSQLCLDWGSGSIPLNEVVRVDKGKQSAVLKRYAKDASVPAHSCFSLVTARRTLDLQVLSTKTLRMQEKRDLLAFGLAEVTDTRTTEDGQPLPRPALLSVLHDDGSGTHGQSALPMPHQKILEAIRAQREGGGRGAGGIVPFVQGGVLDNGIMGTSPAPAAGGSKPGSTNGAGATAGGGVSQFAPASAREKEYSLSTQVSRSQAPYAYTPSMPGTPASTVHTNLRAQQQSQQLQQQPSPSIPRASITGQQLAQLAHQQQQQQQLALQQAALLQSRGSLLVGTQAASPYNQTLLQQHQLQLQQLQQLQQRQLLLAQSQQLGQGGALATGLSPQSVAGAGDLGGTGVLLPPPSFPPLSPSSAAAAAAAAASLHLSAGSVAASPGSTPDPLQQSSLDQMLLRNSILLGQQQLHMHQLGQQQQQQQQMQQQQQLQR